MNFARYSPLVCALILVTHGTHFQTYQGLPEPRLTAAHATTGVRLVAPASPSTFDSEERPQTVEGGPDGSASSAGGGGTGGAVRLEAASGLTIGAPASSSTFDSEEGPRAVDENLPSAAAAGPGGTVAYPGTAEVLAEAFNPTVVTVDGGSTRLAAPASPSSYDSEERPQEVENDPRSRDAASGGGAIITGTAEARGEGVATATAIVTRPDGTVVAGNFDSEELLREIESGPTRDTSATGGGATREVTINDTAGASDSLSVVVHPEERAA